MYWEPLTVYEAKFHVISQSFKRVYEQNEVFSTYQTQTRLGSFQMFYKQWAGSLLNTRCLIETSREFRSSIQNYKPQSIIETN